MKRIEMVVEFLYFSAKEFKRFLRPLLNPIIPNALLAKTQIDLYNKPSQPLSCCFQYLVITYRQRSYLASFFSVHLKTIPESLLH